VELFKKDKSPDKVNLSIGVYKTASGKPHVFKAIRSAEDHLVNSETDKEYNTYSGDPIFLRQAKELIFGQGAKIINRVSLNI
jgi:aspartate/tyrosine/aromatic aminotransferase